jgi:hypothetical protein
MRESFSKPSTVIPLEASRFLRISDRLELWASTDREPSWRVTWTGPAGLSSREGGRFGAALG